MKIDIIKKCMLPTLVSLLLAACCASQIPIIEDGSQDMIPEFFGKNVVLVTGIDFKTGKSIVLNPTTGEEVKPCPEHEIIIEATDQDSNRVSKPKHAPYKTIKNSSNEQPDCNVQFVNPSQELLSAFESSQKIISGFVRKNGTDLPIPAKFITTVTALYEGSDCIDLITADGQYGLCTTLKDDCTFLLPLKRYGNESEAVRKNVRKACGNQPKSPAIGQIIPTPTPLWKKNWRDADCNNLRAIYRTATPTVTETTSEGPVTYTQLYRKYIWDTCHNVPPMTWGLRPTP